MDTVWEGSRGQCLSQQGLSLCQGAEEASHKGTVTLSQGMQKVPLALWSPGGKVQLTQGQLAVKDRWAVAARQGQ